MNDPQQALFFFRKVVFCLYREAGAMNENTHAELSQKAHLKTSFFHGARKRMAVQLYHDIKKETQVSRILNPFMFRTGLNLEDLQQLFAEGNWQGKFKKIFQGGPKWARIAEEAIRLRDAIAEEDWPAALQVTQVMKGMKTNIGFLVDEFELTERKY
jgi:hypothetical protein